MRRIHDQTQLAACIDDEDPSPLLMTDLELPDLDAGVAARVPRGSVFFNCSLGPDAVRAVAGAGASVLNGPATPYDPQRQDLYTADELYSGFDPDRPASYHDTLDARIFRHWEQAGGVRADPAEALAQRLHDHHLTVALDRWIDGHRVVAIMGGHALARTDPRYREVVTIARALVRRGYTIATGGGPGAMEAGHLGAVLAGLDAAQDEDHLDRALRLLAPAPRYTDERWLATAFELRDHLAAEGPPSATSVGVPTWLYGHEPPTPLAPVIAKYFQNSLREEGLVTVARHGIVFAPGSAGTVQELFQDAAQNHYGTVDGLVSPMVLLGDDHWRRQLPVVPVLEQMARGRTGPSMVGVVDDPDSAVAYLVDHPPTSLDAPA